MRESPIRYQPQIDGLRAFAIAPVLLFHAGVPGLPGGFTGVDVFFVISGFLITRIILEDLRLGKFSMASFYERRARRILPALFPVLAASALGAWLLFTGEDFRRFSQALAATAAFGANMLFATKGDYFASMEGFQLLIHSWSLSVEEQFYLLFPAFLIAVTRLRRAALLAVVGTLLASSLALVLVVADHDPQLSFYLLPTRAWELLAGAFIALLEDRCQPREMPSFLGLGMILAGFFLIGAQTPAPGPMFALPVAGTALVLLFSGEHTACGRFLSWRPFVLLGLCSYGTYLWHQPVLALLHYVWFGPPPLGPTVLALVLSLVLGIASYKFIEQPFRRRHLLPNRRVFTAFCIILSGTAVFAGVLGHFRVLEPRNAVPEDSRSGPEAWAILSPVVLPERSSLPFILYGDSHAAQYYTALVERFGEGALITESGCLAAPGISNMQGDQGTATEACRNLPGRLSALVRSRQVPIVIWAQRWDRELFAADSGAPLGGTATAGNQALLGAIDRMITTLPEGVHLVLLGNSPTALAASPEMDGGPIRCRIYVNIDCPTSYPVSMAEGREVNRLLRDFAASHAQVSYVDAAAPLCPSGQCRIIDGETLLYWDGSHMTLQAARRVVSTMAESLLN